MSQYKFLTKEFLFTKVHTFVQVILYGVCYLAAAASMTTHVAIFIQGSALFRIKYKVCSLLEWCLIISIDTCWDWFQRTYAYRPDIFLLTFYDR